MRNYKLILILAAFLLVVGTADAQGKKKIRICYRNAKHLVEKIEVYRDTYENGGLIKSEQFAPDPRSF